jgi:hypothetical protein
MPGSNTETRESDGLGSNLVVHYSVGPTITIHGRIIAMECVVRLGTQIHPMIQTLFPNKDAVLRDNAPTHTDELFSYGLKSVNLNFNIFSGQYNHEI